jgi:hypothetical protein
MGQVCTSYLAQKTLKLIYMCVCVFVFFLVLVYRIEFSWATNYSTPTVKSSYHD